MEVSFEIDARTRDEIERFFRSRPAAARTALMHAANRAGSAALTAAKRAISDELGIRARDLVAPHRFGAVKGESTGRALRLVRATRDNLEALVKISGRRIPVFRFGAARSTAKTRREPVRVLIGGRWKTARVRASGVFWRIGRGVRRFEKNAFIARMSSGHVGVFRRVRGSKKIIELFGPSIPEAARKNAALRAAIDTDVRGVFERRVRHEIDRVMAEK